MPPRTISSTFTFMYKFLMPAFAILATTPVTVCLFLDKMRGANNQPPPEFVKWMALALSIAAFASVLFIPARLKRVQIQADCLSVSNYVQEILVPFKGIRDITTYRWIRGNPVAIHLREPTIFGDKIIFMPRFSLLNWGQPHAIVNELKKLAGLP